MTLLGLMIVIAIGSALIAFAALWGYWRMLEPKRPKARGFEVLPGKESQ